MSTRLPSASQELQFLRFVARQGPITAGRVAEELGGELGVSRSTVLTVLERLRRNGLPERARVREAVTEERQKRRREMLSEIKPSKLNKLRKRLVEVAGRAGGVAGWRTGGTASCS